MVEWERVSAVHRQVSSLRKGVYLVAQEERVSLARGDGSNPLVRQGGHKARDALLAVWRGVNELADASQLRDCTCLRLPVPSGDPPLGCQML